MDIQIDIVTDIATYTLVRPRGLFSETRKNKLGGCAGLDDGGGKSLRRSGHRTAIYEIPVADNTTRDLLCSRRRSRVWVRRKL